MPAQTYSARAVAAIVASKSGQPCTDKQVRSFVRDTVAAYQDDRYTAHAYTVALRDRIVAGMLARRKPNGTGTAGRSTAARKGRGTTATASKGTGTARKPRTAPAAIVTAPAATDADA